MTDWGNNDDWGNDWAETPKRNLRSRYDMTDILGYGGGDDVSGDLQFDRDQLPESMKTVNNRFHDSPLNVALKHLQSMGSKQLPKSVKALKNALKPVCTLVAFTPLSLVLKRLRKEHPELFDIQFAVILGSKSVQKLSNAEQLVIDYAAATARKLGENVPVQMAVPFSKKGKEIQERMMASQLVKESTDLKENLRELVEVCVEVHEIDPERVMLQYLLSSSFVIADDELQNFRVTRCSEPQITKKVLAEFNSGFVTAAKQHVKECRNGDMRLHDFFRKIASNTKTGMESRGFDNRVNTLRPEAAPAVLHLLNLVENKPNNIFTRNEFISIISKFCKVVYACSPALALGFHVKNDIGMSLSSQFGNQTLYSRGRSSGVPYDPILKMKKKSFPQFVTLQFEQLLPNATSSDANMEGRSSFYKATQKHLRFLCNKRSASFVAKNDEYLKKHVKQLYKFISSLQTEDKLHKSKVCEMIFTGMLRSDFLRKMMYSCISVEMVSTDDLVDSLKLVQKIRVGENGEVRYNY